MTINILSKYNNHLLTCKTQCKISSAIKTFAVIGTMFKVCQRLHRDTERICTSCQSLAICLNSPATVSPIARNGGYIHFTLFQVKKRFTPKQLFSQSLFPNIFVQGTNLTSCHLKAKHYNLEINTK